MTTLRLFVSVARTGSFSRAAKELKISQPTASRMIAALEERLGVTLFSRTTRALTLTDAGADYLARVQGVIIALDEADEAIRSGDLQGELRVSTSSIFASQAIVPIIDKFLREHPTLSIELIIDDRRQDLIAENVDLALRWGKLPDSSAVARLIKRWPLIIVAAPRHVREFGAPTHPSDLERHRVVVAGPVAGGLWTFRKDGEELQVKLRGRLKITGSEAAVNAGKAGLGLLVGSYPSYKRDLESGELVRLLPDWKMGVIDLHAVFPSSRAPKPSARLFAEFLHSEMRNF